MKKRIMFVSMLLAGCLFLGGCSQNSRLQVVVPKEKKEWSKDSLLEQVQAPDRYQCDRKMNGIHILANAKVFVPEVEGIRLKKVQTQKFTEELLQRISSAMFQGADVYAREVIYGNKSTEETSESAAEPVTEPAYEEVFDEKEAAFSEKETSLETALKVEKILLSILNGEKSYNSEEIMALGSWCLDMGYSTTNEELQDRLWMNHLICMDLADSGAPWTRLDIQGLSEANYVEGRLFRPDGVGIVQLRSSVYQLDETGFFFLNGPIELFLEEEAFGRMEKQGQDMDGYTNNLLTSETLRNKSNELMYILGRGSLELAGMKKIAVASATGGEIGEVYHYRPGMQFTYNRVVDGVPITITDRNTEYYVSEDGTLIQWPEEEIVAYFDEDELTAFLWTSPIKVEDWQEEYAFLLPFSEIQSIFEEMTFSDTTPGDINWTVGIQEVRLGYAVEPDKDAYQTTTNISYLEDGTAVYSGILIPVWDFIGTAEGDMALAFGVESGSRVSFMTINAMDGSIVEAY